MKTKIKILMKKMLNVLLVLTLGFSLSSITYGNEIGYYDIREVDIAKAMNTDLSNNVITKNLYVKYEEKMRTYGFDKMYDNQSARSDELVTRAEVLKLALSVTFNTDNLDGYSEKEEEYPNAAWVNYAKMMGVTKEDINITNYKDQATYNEAISYFEACRLLFKKDLPVGSVEQAVIKDRTANEEDYLFKGQLNELAVNYAEQYHKENCGIVKALDVRLNKTSVYPGDSFAVFVSNTDLAENFSVSAPFYNKPIQFYKYEDGFVGLIPVYAWSTPGKYQIQVSDVRTKRLTTLEVKIFPKTFDVQYLKVSKSTAAIATTNNSAKDQVHFDAARANPIQEKLWNGAFIQPAKGRITTDYCATRYTNDNPTPSRHLAIDIANNTGTPIMASNNGKVVLAKKLIITGNTIVIDHGLGVFTSYFHLSKILVKEKDFVKKGDIIGKMGSTGYSTGPHLHFAIWKDGTFLNPWTFFEKDPIEFK
ncbi:M23 family metallopeptidase [Cellulosilyticum sp. I15G10I2]|uniref:M23 family metallopeptidase n=1 Tax=Cellulosilyticum sp. I15G10I2 TaxID=1892843 RepID=UPI00085C4D2E|nr:M23 family metallopeptidase [Cellulosilyticum sp. I15G10I2]